MEARLNLLDLCRKINDNHYEITSSCAEYKALEWLTDEQIDVMLAFKGGCMDMKSPNFAIGIARRAKMPLKRTKEVLHELNDLGLIIRLWALPGGIKRGKRPKGLEVYIMPLYTPGIFEFLMLNEENIKKHPEIAQGFKDHATKSQEDFAANIPMGAGVMRVIPVESAIDANPEVIDKERCSYYIKKHKDHITALPCQCRRVRKMLNEGAGDMDEAFCIFVGPVADMFVGLGKGDYITEEEAMNLLEKYEKIGCVHQITTLDDGDTAAICNCQVQSCLALGVTQLFNVPKHSASNFVAEITPEKCVACGECTKVCGNNAIVMGQKINCKKPITWPKVELCDDLEWGPERWDPEYRYKYNYVGEMGTSPCKTACPAHISVQGYIKLASQGKYLEALDLIKHENPFPAVCGRICNRRCETACTRGDIDSPVAIDDIKRFIADLEIQEQNRVVPEVLHDYDGKIAVIGGGPAGLSCAYYLAAAGHEVTVFEKNEKLGGMLVYGIPSFRLEKDVIEAEIDVLRKLGVEFRTGVEVGKDVTIEELRKEFDGFYVAIGAQGGRKLGIEGEDAEGVVAGVKFLRDVNGNHDMKLDGNVVVIGGGNVAVDVARAAKRVSNGEVTMLCLESAAEMPADPLEVEEATEEGIFVKNGWGPTKILTKDGKVTGIEFKKCLSVFDERHRFAPVFDEKETLTIECNHVLLSIGQAIEWGNLLEGTKVEFNKNGTAKADSFTYQTAEEDIFVGGDVYTGPKFAIDAIAAGKEGAESLHRYVSEGQSLTAGRDHRDFHSIDKKLIDFDAVKAKESFDNGKRQVPAHKKGAKKLSFEDTRLALTEQQVKAETSRCLGCGASHVDENRCIGCGLCTVQCKFDAIHLKKVRYESTIPYLDRHEALPKFYRERQEKIRIRKAKEAGNK